MLSGNQLNDSIFNLDSFQDYAIISQADMQLIGTLRTEGTTATADFPTDVSPRTNELLPTPAGGAGFALGQDLDSELVDPLGDVTWHLSNSSYAALPRTAVGEVGPGVVVIGPTWDVGYAAVGDDVGVVDWRTDSSPTELADSLYASRFDGTSADRPVVAGVIAQMLEADSNLTYHDVQDALAKNSLEHETAVAGLVAADASNGVGSTGISYQSTMQFAGSQPSGTAADTGLNNSPTAGQATATPAEAPVITVRPAPSNVADSDAQQIGSMSGLPLRDRLRDNSHTSNLDANRAQVVVDLLAQDVIIAGNSGATDSTGIVEHVEGVITDAAAELTQPAAEASATGTAVIATIAEPTEGGMVCLEEIVASAHAAPTASRDSQLASAENETPIVGELTRVAVMELIEGQADPAAARSDSEYGYVGVLATDSAPSRGRAVAPHAAPSVAERALEVLAEQAAAGISLVAPVSPGQLIAAVGPLQDAVRTASLASPADLPAPPPEAARHAAFSQWDDRTPRTSADAADRRAIQWSVAAPILMALACDCVAAAQEKRQRRDGDRQAAQARRLSADAR